MFFSTGPPAESAVPSDLNDLCSLGFQSSFLHYFIKFFRRRRKPNITYRKPEHYRISQNIGGKWSVKRPPAARRAQRRDTRNLSPDILTKMVNLLFKIESNCLFLSVLHLLCQLMDLRSNQQTGCKSHI